MLLGEKGHYLQIPRRNTFWGGEGAERFQMYLQDIKKTINSHVILTSFLDYNIKISFASETKITRPNILDHNQA